MVKIPKIKVCNPSLLRKACSVASLTNQCHVIFKITFHVFFSLTHICSSHLMVTDGIKLFQIVFNKIGIFNKAAIHALSGQSCLSQLLTADKDSHMLLIVSLI